MTMTGWNHLKCAKRFSGGNRTDAKFRSALTPQSTNVVPVVLPDEILHSISQSILMNDEHLMNSLAWILKEFIVSSKDGNACAVWSTDPKLDGTCTMWINIAYLHHFSLVQFSECLLFWHVFDFFYLILFRSLPRINKKIFEEIENGNLFSIIWWNQPDEICIRLYIYRFRQRVLMKVLLTVMKC